MCAYMICTVHKRNALAICLQKYNKVIISGISTCSITISTLVFALTYQRYNRTCLIIDYKSKTLKTKNFYDVKTSPLNSRRPTIYMYSQTCSKNHLYIQTPCL